VKKPADAEKKPAEKVPEKTVEKKPTDKLPEKK
jgi:hypothetical protein